jgi:hypothetical protein
MQGSSPNSKRSNAGRPLSTGGGNSASDGQLNINNNDTKHITYKASSPTSEHYSFNNENNTNTHHIPTPEGSMSSILRNINNTTLSEFASSFNRKSTILSAVPDDEHEEEPTVKKVSGHGHSSSYSGTSNNHNTFPSSSGKRSSFNGAMISGNGGSLNGGHASGPNSSGAGSGMGRRTISIQQLDTLWQDSGSKIMNFVHHGSDTPSNSFKSNIMKEEEKRILAEWDRRSESSSNEKFEEASLKVIIIKIRLNYR